MKKKKQKRNNKETLQWYCNILKEETCQNKTKNGTQINKTKKKTKQDKDRQQSWNADVANRKNIFLENSEINKKQKINSFSIFTTVSSSCELTIKYNLISKANAIKESWWCKKISKGFRYLTSERNRHRIH